MGCMLVPPRLPRSVPDVRENSGFGATPRHRLPTGQYKGNSIPVRCVNLLVWSHRQPTLM